MWPTSASWLGSILRFSDFEIFDFEIFGSSLTRYGGSPEQDQAVTQIWIHHAPCYLKRKNILICPRPRPAPGHGDGGSAPPRAMAMGSEARNNFIRLADDGLRN